LETDMQPYHQVNAMVNHHMAALANEAEARRRARRRGDDHQARSWRRPRRRAAG